MIIAGLVGTSGDMMRHWRKCLATLLPCWVEAPGDSTRTSTPTASTTGSGGPTR
jgi:hypothetical protein